MAVPQFKRTASSSVFIDATELRVRETVSKAKIAKEKKNCQRRAEEGILLKIKMCVFLFVAHEYRNLGIELQEGSLLSYINSAII